MILRICSKPSLVISNSKYKSIRLKRRIYPYSIFQLKQHPCFDTYEKQLCKLYNTFSYRLNDQGKSTPLKSSLDDYFTLFSLPKSYDIDKNKLHYHYIELQKKLHPDSHSNVSEEEKMFYQNETSSIINAYKTLKDDYLRAIYLLEKHGIYFTEESHIGGLLENDSEANMFLMEMFDIREQIEMINDKESMEELISENKDKIKKCIDELSIAFRENDIERAKNKTILLKFLNKIVEEAENKLFDLSNQ